MSLNALLEQIGAYLETPDEACWTLPPEAYVSRELHELEVRRIFERSWLCVGREEYVPNAGDYYTIDVMGEPVIVVRGKDGRVRALNAACRHRFMPVAAGKGNVDRFVCPYHSWTYATDGRLIGAAHMERSRVFDTKSCGLSPYRLDSWMGFLFVNLDDDAKPLQPTMAAMERATAHYRIAEQTEIFHYEKEWAGNWKLSAENSMEYYHHLGLHLHSIAVQTPAKGTYMPTGPVLPDETFTQQRCRMETKRHAMNPHGDLRGFTEEELSTAYMVYVFPAFTMAMRPGTNNWLSFRPAGPEKTNVLGGYLMWKDIAEEEPELARARRELIMQVNDEDEHATSDLAKVLRSRKAARGPLSHFEATIAQFYRYLARALCADRIGAEKAAE
jgi:phenylpropionate dioxygenase-like ring-hydroxylating dioxygenase large terminal subunit